MSSVKTESDLHSELDRLNSRLAQGERDHARSHDDLQRLEGEIRGIKSALRGMSREAPEPPVV